MDASTGTPKASATTPSSCKTSTCPARRASASVGAHGRDEHGVGPCLAQTFDNNGHDILEPVDAPAAHRHCGSLAAGDPLPGYRT